MLKQTIDLQYICNDLNCKPPRLDLKISNEAMERIVKIADAGLLQGNDKVEIGVGAACFLNENNTRYNSKLDWRPSSVVVVLYAHDAQNIANLKPGSENAMPWIMIKDHDTGQEITEGYIEISFADIQAARKVPDASLREIADAAVCLVDEIGEYDVIQTGYGDDFGVDTSYGLLRAKLRAAGYEWGSDWQSEHSSELALFDKLRKGNVVHYTDTKNKDQPANDRSGDYLLTSVIAVCDGEERPGRIEFCSSTEDILVLSDKNGKKIRAAVSEVVPAENTVMQPASSPSPEDDISPTP